MSVVIDGKSYRTLVSCHDGEKWVEQAAKVPWWVIATLPEDEQRRVKAHQ